MFKVKVSATSANVGCGFDVLGLSFDLFNVYSFKESDEFSLKGFAPRYLDINKNLVLSSYLKAYEYAGKIPVKVEICEEERNIPRAGGLGSSASCAVAGIMGANKMMGGILSKEEMLLIATEIDGHADNVSAVIYGGLTACFKDGKGYSAISYGVSEKLKFTVCYPDFYVSTEMARQALPKTIEVKKAVENMSHIVNMPYAFEKGDIALIRKLVGDNIHEPYRIKLIDEGELIRSTAERFGGVAVISGSGATMLVMSDNDECEKALKELKTKNKWTIRSVKPYFGGEL